MQIVFQDIVQKYGADKGVYVQVAEISNQPGLFLRDGRLVAVLDADIRMYVDTDSSKYPS